MALIWVSQIVSHSRQRNCLVKRNNSNCAVFLIELVSFQNDDFAMDKGERNEKLRNVTKNVSASVLFRAGILNAVQVGLHTVV